MKARVWVILLSALFFLGAFKVETADNPERYDVDIKVVEVIDGKKIPVKESIHIRNDSRVKGLYDYSFDENTGILSISIKKGPVYDFYIDPSIQHPYSGKGSFFITDEGQLNINELIVERYEIVKIKGVLVFPEDKRVRASIVCRKKGSKGGVIEKYNEKGEFEFEVLKFTEYELEVYGYEIKNGSLKKTIKYEDITDEPIIWEVELSDQNVVISVKLRLDSNDVPYNYKLAEKVVGKVRNHYIDMSRYDYVDSGQYENKDSFLYRAVFNNEKDSKVILPNLLPGRYTINNLSLFVENGMHEFRFKKYYVVDGDREFIFHKDDPFVEYNVVFGEVEKVRVRGVVSDENGNPLAKVPIKFNPEKDRVVGEPYNIRTDDGGEFEIELFKDTYKIEVYSYTHYLDIKEITFENDINIKWTMKEYPHLSGKILDIDGKPVKDAVVELEGSGGVGCHTDENGKYIIKYIKNKGIFALIVRHTDYALQEKKIEFNGTGTEDFQIVKGNIVQGTIKDDFQLKEGYRYFMIFIPRGSEFIIKNFCEVEGNGDFSVYLLPDDYYVIIYESDAGKEEKYYPISSLDVRNDITDLVLPVNYKDACTEEEIKEWVENNPDIKSY